MAVENVEYIDSLDPESPVGGDSISEGDDHIRNIKSAIKKTFPNVTEPVLLTADDLNSLLGGGSSQLAHAKYSTSEGLRYDVNVDSIKETSKGNFTVKFSVALQNYGYTIVITPMAVNGKPVISYVTSQALLNPGGDPTDPNDYTPNGFEMQIREFDSNGSLILPSECVFSFLVVDNDPFGRNNP